VKTLDIYTRVSNKSGDSKRVLSTEGQEIECRARVAAVGAQLGRVFCDPGRSAWKPNVRRPGWEALMARLEAGESDGVVVYDLPRFARQPDDGSRLIKAAERGLSILDSDSEYNLQSPSGKKNFRDAMNAAAYYSDMISASSRRGKKLKARRGEVDPKRSFGFEHDGETIRENEAAVIRDHAARLLAGESQDSLIKEMTKNGVRTVNGNEFVHMTYRKMMLKPRNAGYIVHRGEIVEGKRLAGTPILDEKTFNRLVALFSARRRGRQPSGRYTATGFVICGNCGAGMNGRPVSHRNSRQYWCAHCRKVSISAAKLEDWAGDFAIHTLADPAHAEAVERADRELSDKRSALVAERAEIEHTLTVVAGRVGRREWTLVRHDAIAAPLEARLTEIADGLAELDAQDAAERATALPAGARTIDPKGRAYMAQLIEWDEGGSAQRRPMLLRALGGRKIVVAPANGSMSGRLSVA
jgi:DNA invertase Pin-like site-specific DNA recombinase